MHRLDAIGDEGLRATFLFARARPLPVTADEVAAAQNVHRNVARGRLERLAEAGLLVPSYERRNGRTGPGAGRPAKTYRVAPELSAIEFPERGYEQLIGLLVDALPRAGRDRRLDDVGAAFGRELARRAGVRPARSLRGALRRMSDALGRLGFHATVDEVGEDQGVVATATCPLRPLVRARPDLAGLDRAMWTALAESAGAADVVCDTSRCQIGEADCRVHITARRTRTRRRF